MFKNHILQVSNSNNANKSLSISPANSVFSTTFKKPINIGIGDVITLNSAYIDLRQNSNNQIYLDTPQTLTFQFYYYHTPTREDNIDYGNTNDTGSAWGFDSSIQYKGQPYILCVSKRNYYTEPYNGTKRINPLTGRAYLDEYNENIFTNFYTTDGTDAPYFVPEVISPQSVNDGNRQAFCNQYTPYIGTYTMTLPANSYTPSSIAEYITSFINKQISYGQNNSNQTYYKSFLKTYAGNSFLQEQFIFSTNPFIFNLFQIMEQELYYYYVTGSSSNPPNKLTLFIFQNIYGFDFFRPTTYMYAGTQEITLLYNDQGGSANYSFVNHTPIINNGSLSVMYRSVLDPSQQILGSLGCYLFSKVSGVAFKSIEPKSFWYDTLGFTDDILMTVDSNNNTTEANYKASTSDTFVSLSQIIYQSTYTNNAVNQSQPGSNDLFFVSQNFVEITAKNQYQQSATSGHLLIESTAYNTDMQDDSGSFQIKNIVSSYYLSAGQFLAGSQLGAIPYQHIGDDMPISQITVRILDPETKQPIPSGIKNTVYFEIQKNIAIEQDKQVIQDKQNGKQQEIIQEK
jgi:hypothetical protein